MILKIEGPYAAQIKEFWEAEADLNEDEALGFHGTSIEAVAELAQSGKLPCSWNGEGSRNRFYFFRPGETREGYGSGHFAAEHYATIIARAHAFAMRFESQLGKISSRDLFNIRDALIDIELGLDLRIKFIKSRKNFKAWMKEEVATEWLFKCCNRTGIDWRELINFVHEFRRLRGGVCLWLRKSLEQDFTVIDALGETGDDGWYIELPEEGLSIEYILAIEALNADEYDALDKIGKNPKN